MGGLGMLLQHTQNCGMRRTAMRVALICPKDGRMGIQEGGAGQGYARLPSTQAQPVATRLLSPSNTGDAASASFATASLD